MIVRKVNNLRKSSNFSHKGNMKPENVINDSYNSNPNMSVNILESEFNYDSNHESDSNYKIYRTTETENDKKYLSEINSDVDFNSQK
jgi:hypothetical protein